MVAGGRRRQPAEFNGRLRLGMTLGLGSAGGERERRRQAAAGLRGRQWASVPAKEWPTVAVTAAGRNARQRGARGRGRKPDPMDACASFEWKGGEKGGGAPAVGVVCGGRRRAAAPVAGGWLLVGE